MIHQRLLFISTQTMKSCPLCYSPLETRECTPCHDCGANKIIVEGFEQKKPSFNRYEVRGIYINLCSFCVLDFGSYKSDFLGLPRGKRLGFEQFNFVKEIEPVSEKDLFCTECGHRLAFLKFIQAFRERV